MTDLLTEGATNLRDYFQAQGYFDVEVEFQETEGGRRGDRNQLCDRAREHGTDSFISKSAATNISTRRRSGSGCFWRRDRSLSATGATAKRSCGGTSRRSRIFMNRMDSATRRSRRAGRGQLQRPRGRSGRVLHDRRGAAVSCCVARHQRGGETRSDKDERNR